MMKHLPNLSIKREVGITPMAWQFEEPKAMYKMCP